MRPLPRAFDSLRSLRPGEKKAVVLWGLISFALWNAMYDQILEKGIKEYLFRSTLHEAGRAPGVAIATVLAPFQFDAIWVSTFWAGLVMLAGLLTIRLRRTE